MSTTLHKPTIYYPLAIPTLSASHLVCLNYSGFMSEPQAEHCVRQHLLRLQKAAGGNKLDVEVVRPQNQLILINRHTGRKVGQVSKNVPQEKTFGEQR